MSEMLDDDANGINFHEDDQETKIHPAASLDCRLETNVSFQSVDLRKLNNRLRFLNGSPTTPSNSESQTQLLVDIVDPTSGHTQRWLLHSNKVLSSRLQNKLLNEGHQKEQCELYRGTLNEHDVVAAEYCADADGNAASFSGAVISDEGTITFEQPAHNTGSNTLLFTRLNEQTDNEDAELPCALTSVLFGGSSMAGKGIRSKRALGDRPDYYAKYVTWDRERVVELVLVNDKSMASFTVAKYDNNKQTVIDHSIQVANYVNAIYWPLRIRVVLVDVVVWDRDDEIAVTADSSRTLDNFMRYRQQRLWPIIHHDNAHLLTNVVFANGVIGKAHKHSMCSMSNSGGVNHDRSHHAVSVGSTIAHEMGHNFGMEHDSTTGCECAANHCVMEPLTGTLSPTVWSVCSLEYLAESFKQNMDSCLLNEPDAAYDAPVCGNGLTEEGEDCDCGTVESCENLCCNAATCKFRGEAQCATGPCCDEQACKFKSAGTVCRSGVGECDLDEYCDGGSVHCPRDVFAQDGVQCNEPSQDKDDAEEVPEHMKSYCASGVCGNRDSQCRLLWGETGKNSPDVCYGQNTKRAPDISGNCGYDGQRYLSCSEHNAKCGRLHCVHSNERPAFSPSALKEYTYSYFTISNTQITQCRVARFDLPKDPGMVPDGAGCGINKMCDNATCTPVAYVLNRRACDSDCGWPERGVCNSQGNCHCFGCYGGDDCSGRGYGGSIDSGPACSSAGLNWLLVLFVILLLTIPVLAALYFWRKRNGKPVPDFAGMLSSLTRMSKSKAHGPRSVQRDYIGSSSGGGPKPANSPGKSSRDNLPINVEKPAIPNVAGYHQPAPKAPAAAASTARYGPGPTPALNTTVTYKPNGIAITQPDAGAWKNVDLTSPTNPTPTVDFKQPARQAPAPPQPVHNEKTSMPPSLLASLVAETERVKRSGSPSTVQQPPTLGSSSSASTLTRQPSLRPAIPPPQRPDRPRESVLERLYEKKGAEIGLGGDGMTKERSATEPGGGGGAGGLAAGFADEVLGALGTSASSASIRSRDSSVNRSVRPSKQPPPPPATKPAVKPHGASANPPSNNNNNNNSYGDEDESNYYDVIGSPLTRRPVAKPSLPEKPVAATKKPTLPVKPTVNNSKNSQPAGDEATVKVSDIKARFEKRNV